MQNIFSDSAVFYHYLGYAVLVIFKLNKSEYKEISFIRHLLFLTVSSHASVYNVF